jgi:hypothetical protein
MFGVILAALATVAGCADAVGWMIATFGTTATGMAAAFVVGWVLATAVARARVHRGRPSPPVTP